ncbi:hypothetical protein BJV82DRAFT_597038 [Fennellomyces sp. T-0311]|nr:hypothetical protein BJV82DRAFT_597038 [Fennellomyces sp. T-0311]
MVKAGFLVAAATCVVLFASSGVQADDQSKCKCEDGYKLATPGCCAQAGGRLQSSGEECVFPTRSEAVEDVFLKCCNPLGILDRSEYNYGRCGD